MKRILITGSTGFIGQRLAQHLRNTGAEVVGLSRQPDAASRIQWTNDVDLLAEKITGIEAIYHLAGENIAGGLFTSTRKTKIRSSRVDSGKLLVQAIERCKTRPKFFFQASGIGYYGNSASSAFDESSAQGEGFLASVCKDWENATAPLEKLGVRRVIGRIGIVLGEQGFLEKVTPPMKFFSGGHFGTGENILSWIHIEDCVRAMEFLSSKPYSGIFNLTAPNPVSSKLFFKTLGKSLRRPSWFHVPEFMIKMLGEFGREVLLSGQQVVPGRLKDASFEFNYSSLPAALDDICA